MHLLLCFSTGVFSFILFCFGLEVKRITPGKFGILTVLVEVSGTDCDCDLYFLRQFRFNK